MDDRDDHCRDRTAEDGAREERHDSRGHGREQLAGQFHDRRQVLEPDAAGPAQAHINVAAAATPPEWLISGSRSAHRPSR